MTGTGVSFLVLERKITTSKAIQRLLQNWNCYFASHWHRSLEVGLMHFTARPVATRRIDRNNYKIKIDDNETNQYRGKILKT